MQAENKAERLRIRNQVQDALINAAKSDSRITDAAIVGSEAVGNHDQWSDIDLSFAVADEHDLKAVLNDFTKVVEENYDCNQLLDIHHLDSIYRVFFLHNCLQIDLSFTPSSKYKALTPYFKSIFGKEQSIPSSRLPDPKQLYAYASLYALKCKRAIERENFWQALTYLNNCRNFVLKLACIKYGQIPSDEKGYDALPTEFYNELKKTQPSTIDDMSLRVALKYLVHLLLSFGTAENDNADFRIQLNQLAE